MNKFFLIIGCLSLAVLSFSQTITQKVQNAFQFFENDVQCKYAISSLYIIEAKTGKVIFDRHSRIGLAPASTQKVITSVTAFELLGKEFRYKTGFGIDSDNYSGLYIIPGGDPTLGSPRWNGTKANEVIKRILQSVPENVKEFNSVLVNNLDWETKNIPDGWIWQDIGNYYGAGAGKLNWRENQFDIILKSGASIGDPVQIVKTEPELLNYDLNSQVVSASKGSGDNAYIYLPLNGVTGSIKGTIPIKENNFVISGAFPSSSGQFTGELLNALKSSGKINPAVALEVNNHHKPVKVESKNYKVFHSEISPSLDSIIYWFLKKSINLYGEALIKTFAFEKKGIGSTDSGVAIMKDFWKQKGMDKDELNISDGSGLSPQNRVTTHAQVEILKFAHSREWFPFFYKAMPLYNGMTMKSGTIKDVKGFCGYHTAKNGTEYIFSFLVNNYTGSSSQLVNKMYKVLDTIRQ
ncbi:MAG: D-alanyl-D-alanine carboxypeptidase/D-alanyl-D-alanine endopeptidase [Chitinophagaceae bacterium]